MSRITKITVTALCLVIMAGTTIAAEDVSVDVSVDYVGKYIWRGQVLTDDPALQTGVTLGMENLSFNIWGSMDTTNWNSTNYKDSGEYRELDYTLDYSDELGCLDGTTYSVGTIVYHFPTTTGDNVTTEVYAGLGFDTLLSPTVTLYYDVDDATGYYASFGMSHTIDLSDIGQEMITGLDLSAALGLASSNYNDYYWGTSVDNATNDLVLSVSLPVTLSNNITLTGSVSYVTLTDKDVRATNTYNSGSDYIYGGIGLAMSF